MPFAEFEELLRSLFTVDELRCFVSHHVGSLSSAVNWGAPPEKIAFDVVDFANRHNLIDAALWSALRAERPERRADIDRVASLFAAGAPVQPAAPPAPPAAPATPAVPRWTHWVPDPEGIDELSEAQLDDGQGRTAKFELLVEALGSWGNNLETDGNATTRIRRALYRLNRIRNLVTGEIPLQRWLREAKFLARGNANAVAVFNKYLQVFPGADVQAPKELPPITEDEADDMHLTPEAQIGAKDQTVAVSFLHRGWMASRSVARLRVPRFGNGEKLMDGDQPELSSGTGWLIAPDLLITSHHVVAARAPDEDSPSALDFELQALGAVVEFDLLEKDAPSIARQVTQVLVADPSPAHDFAVLRLASWDDSRPPLRLRKSTYKRDRGFELNPRVNVLQHPDGKPMRLGFRDNFVLFGNASSLAYLTDTDHGSSGAPVLDDEWRVVALHRGSRDLAKPVSLRNHEIRVENFGPAVVAILERLKQRHPDVHKEILAAQQALGPGE